MCCNLVTRAIQKHYFANDPIEQIWIVSYYIDIVRDHEPEFCSCNRARAFWQTLEGGQLHHGHINVHGRFGRGEIVAQIGQVAGSRYRRPDGGRRESKGTICARRVDESEIEQAKRGRFIPSRHSAQ